MVSGRTVNGNPQSSYPFGVDGTFGLWSRTISASATTAGLLAKLDQAIACKATYRMHGHRVVSSVTDSSNEILISDFKTLIDGVQARVYAGSVDVVTVDQWARGCGLQ